MAAPRIALSQSKYDDGLCTHVAERRGRADCRRPRRIEAARARCWSGRVRGRVGRDGVDRLSGIMSTTNDLRFAMAVHLLRKSNPATRQAVHRPAGHRGGTRRQPERTVVGEHRVRAGVVTRSGVGRRIG